MNDDTEHQEASQGFVPVCAIGASAGGVMALQGLFRQLPDDLGLAYVVILHLSPDQPSALSEILSVCTRMPVVQIDDGPTLKPNCVYVIPPDRELVIEGDSVTARPFTEPRGRRAPIDMFFRSIAAARGDGIAVVLSGAGSDGTLGLRAVKEAGGVIMVQEPAEAGFGSMPQNAIATGDADFVAPLARLAERLAEVARSKEAVRSLDVDGSANDLRRIVAFLRSRTGHDFSSYKRATVMRRVLRRMQVCRTDTLGAYADYLLTTPEETKELFSDLLISVTMFFRDPGAFAALERLVIGPLSDDMDPGSENGIRTWVVGCATGEEAYSLGMLLLEEAGRRRLHPQIQIFATDLDEGALATAREGRYPRTIEADISDERLARFFTNEGTHYRVRKELRDCVLFAKHSAIKEPPFMRLDLVTCRNLLIYLERSLQQQLCTLFHYGLKPGRFLFLGSAETADSAADLFAPLDRDARIYGSRPHASQTLPILPQFAAPERLTVPGQAILPRLERPDLPAALHVAALEGSAPPSALVDDGHAILHLSPTAGQFIQPSAGPFSNLLPAVVHPELRLDLRLALTRALEGKEPTLTLPVAIAIAAGTRRVAMHVIPVSNAAHMGAQALVLFLDGGAAPGDREPDATPDTRPDEVRRLHAELKASQEALVASRSGHEAAIQDLRATNEELQSMNEEYRSTAEELETSKEELQSINEELHTVNAELKSKLTSISVAHSDLQNLTTATEIGTLFLDADLRIKMFTPPVADLFSITTADIGRTITDFTHRLEYDTLEADAHRVLRDLVPVEEEVRSRGGHWYVVRLRPYRTVEDRIDGTVVTFVDITARRKAEAALRTSEARLRGMADTAPVLIWETDESGLVFSNRHYLEFFGLEFEDVRSMGWARFLHPDDAEAYAAAYQAAFNKRRSYAHEARFLRADGQYRWLRNSGGPAGESGFVGCSVDVTDLLAAQFALRESEELRRIALQGGRMGAWRWNLHDRLIWGDAEFLALWGLPPSDEPLPLSMFTDRMTPEGAAEMEVIVTKAIEAGEEFDGPLEVVSGLAAGRWIRWRGRAGSGTPSVLYGVTFDITQQRQGEAALRESEERYRSMFETMDEGYLLADVIFDAQGKAVDIEYVKANPAAIRMVGSDLTGRRLRDVAEYEEYWYEIWGRVARTGDPEHLERYAAPDGIWYDFHVFKTEPDNAASRRVGVLFKDVTRRKLAEDALRESEERFRQFGEASQDVLWIRNADTLQWEYLTPAFEAIYGLDRNSALRGDSMANWVELILPEDRERAVGSIQRVRDGEWVTFEYRVRRPVDGQVRWLRNTDFPIRDAPDAEHPKGRVIRIGGVGHDITDEKRATERQDVLVAELQHRTRNLLAVVRNVARRSIPPSPGRDEYDARLAALGRVQGFLSRSTFYSVPLADVVDAELQAVGDGASDKVEIGGPPVELPGESVQAVALALHELATNAVKYGTIAQASGRLKVVWRIEAGSEGAQRLVIDWRESGVAMPDGPPVRQGYGSELITRALPYQLKAETALVFTHDGVHCRIALPASAFAMGKEVHP